MRFADKFLLKYAFYLHQNLPSNTDKQLLFSRIHHNVRHIFLYWNLQSIYFYTYLTYHGGTKTLNETQSLSCWSIYMVTSRIHRFSRYLYRALSSHELPSLSDSARLTKILRKTRPLQTPISERSRQSFLLIL